MFTGDCYLVVPLRAYKYLWNGFIMTMWSKTII